ncbi:PEP-CTERM sorting domain-containing protein [Roseateles sp.]|uniref:PEP-CTERM sorting domain-containing protein n=1 Tax=Roseateles sp. TaxID=1971397 RepID=UPI003BA8EDE2
MLWRRWPSTTTARQPWRVAAVEKPKLSRLALLAALCTAANAQAANVTFNSETSFLAAVGAVNAETFNAFSTDTNNDLFGVPKALTLSGFTLKGAWNVDAPDPGTDPLRTIDGSTHVLIDLAWGGGTDLRFDAPTKAFGAWFRGAPTAIKVDGDSLDGFGSYRHVAELRPEFAAQSALQFIGFTSDQTFNRLIFLGNGCCRWNFAIDNLSYAATLAPVPEPESWALMAAGLLGLGARAWRKAAQV